MLSQLIAMNGYGMYVWTAYGITVVVLSINIFLSILEKLRIKQIIKKHGINEQVPSPAH